MHKNKLSYVGVKGVIVNDADEVLITQEPTSYEGGGRWELPGGKIVEGEENTPLQEILRREIHEELGDHFDVEIGDVIDVMRRPWNKPGALSNEVFLAVYECHHRAGHVILSHENNDFAWVHTEDLRRFEFIPGYLSVLEKYFKIRHN